MESGQREDYNEYRPEYMRQNSGLVESLGRGNSISGSSINKNDRARISLK